MNSIKNIISLLGVLCFFSSCEKKQEFNGFTYPHGKFKALIMSYDDGTIEDLELIELFNKNNIIGTFNLNSAYLGKTLNWPQQDGDTIFQEYVPKEDLSKTYKNHEIAVHGAYHKDFIKISKNEVLEEIETDLTNLRKLAETKITSMAYPFGNTNDSIAKWVLSTGITNARTVADTHLFSLPSNFLMWNPTCHDSKSLEYLDKFLNLEKSDLSLFYVWGHSWEFKNKERWNIITKFCNKIGKEKNIWSIGTGEYTNYLRAIEKVEIGNGEIYNPTDNSPVWILLSDKIKKLSPGERLRVKNMIK